MTTDERLAEAKAAFEKAKAALARVELEKEKEDSLTIVHRLAIVMHDKNCSWNHTDGCGWFYEYSKGEHKWDGHAHKEWLSKARKAKLACDSLGITEDEKILSLAITFSRDL